MSLSPSCPHALVPMHTWKYQFSQASLIYPLDSVTSCFQLFDWSTWQMWRCNSSLSLVRASHFYVSPLPPSRHVVGLAKERGTYIELMDGIKVKKFLSSHSKLRPLARTVKSRGYVFYVECWGLYREDRDSVLNSRSIAVGMYHEGGFFVPITKAILTRLGYLNKKFLK
jgi:hypothetical protein